jgi:hypothetical protein
VKGKITDKDGGFTEYTASVTVTNVAPTADFDAESPVDEGSSIALSLTNPFDPSSADTAAGFSYEFDCGSGYAASATGTASCPADDNGSRTVQGKITDKDGGFTEYSATVSIDNVAPTATFNAPVSVNEGSPIALSLTDPHDPSTVDTGAGFSYAFDCGDGAGLLAAPSDSTSCPTNDNGARSVGGSISDKDGDATTYGVSVAVDNVAPTATLDAPASVNEGDSFTVSLTGASDPSSVDTAAGFSYAFDCGSGFGSFGASSSTSCSTTDNGSRTVKGSIKDKDGGVSTYTASVTINNVAPTASFNAPVSVNEGSAINLSLTGASDPSSVDTAAGFSYAFDCGSGFGSFGASSSTSCSTTDNGGRTVKGSIKDKDGGVSTYTASVTINNVAPTINGFTVTQPSGTACATSSVTVAFTVTDPADQSADPIVGLINWGDGDTTPITGRTVSASHSYAPGVYSLTATVNDGDGGTANAGSAGNVSLLYSTTGVLQPVNSDGTSTFKLGSTIPTKLGVTDCTGANVGTLTLEVLLTKISGTTTPVNEVLSSSAADNGDVMRYDGSRYIFNLSTKRSQFNAGNDLTAGRYRMRIEGVGVTPVVVEFSLKA